MRMRPCYRVHVYPKTILPCSWAPPRRRRGSSPGQTPWLVTPYRALRCLLGRATAKRNPSPKHDEPEERAYGANDNERAE